MTNHTGGAKMKITRDQVSMAYDELDRRMRITIRDEDLTADEIQDIRSSMLQGLYSVFYALATNWPQVRCWTDEEERLRGYYDEEEGEIY